MGGTDMSTTVTTSLNPWGPVSQTHRVRAYQRGRVCAHDGCDTILSVYNPSAYCGAHAEMARNKRRRGELHPVREVACEHCGTAFETQNTHRRYCSDRCRMAAFARRKRAAQRAQARLREPGRETAELVGVGAPGDAA
jgi:predicted nucleic acid-binding Zn ribbon protein